MYADNNKLFLRYVIVLIYKLHCMEYVVNRVNTKNVKKRQK